LRLKVKKVDTEEPYDIDAAQDWDDDGIEIIELNIEMNPKLFTKSLINKFQGELKDVIRHEIEHLYQSLNPNKKVKFTDNENFVEEVLSPRELPAYIQGFYSQAKTRKMYMDDIIDEWANDRTKQFDSIEDKEYVKSELKKFGKKLLPQANWR
jgi:predicted SprT family Zn-dependent metalloprotease